MTRTYKLKKVPRPVKEFFELNFPPKKGFTYDFYYYKLNQELPADRGNKIYGCNVSKGGLFHHNATQASIDWFEQNRDNNIYNQENEDGRFRACQYPEPR